MEKLLISAAVITALAFTACGGTTDEGEGDKQGNGSSASNWYVTNTEGGTAAIDNTVSLDGTGDFYVYIYFDAVGKPNYTNIILDVVINPGQNVSQQCVYTAGGTWGKNLFLDWFDTGVISIPAASFDQKWGDVPENTLDLATIKGLCIVVSVGTGTATVKINDVRFE
ncbi:MAG: hypothetical protein LBH75_03665 [Treponema sp.]|nr:hypothetical protein [Treponema sp.]